MNRYDAIVIGAGPSGSTAAAVLASKGRRVLAIEREKFPRYHVGESLIPYTYFPLERIGMIERMKKSHFPSKYSVQFVGRSGNLSQPFYFFEHLKHEAACTWQVLRSEFDQMLMDNAREKGVEVLEETKVTETIDENGTVTGVRAKAKDEGTLEFRAPITIDASGRDSLSMLRNNWRVRDDQLKKISIWTYYKGALRDPGRDEGATTIASIPERGWFWYIPLPDDMVSVGVVAESDYLYRDTRDLEEIFVREVTNNRWIEKHLAIAQRTEPLRVTGEFSYRSRYTAADGLVLTGDAFGFLDPVFSSGLFFALRGGELVADAVDAALTAGDYSAGRFNDYANEMCSGMEAMRRLVYAFYDHGFSFADLMKEHPDLSPDLTDCLIGNLSRDFEPLFKAVSKFAAVPDPLSHGRPLAAA
ncbi:MAG: NAD(P)/FAD-dependent oxidoreductase [Bryobacterales bacterium]|nr:NAD(P)/FAD-dependent oxidoreductase [Bryobacterales bacterium]MDE0296588.1 NAD(P)/FAD-dependent oxidoreductase [Bryobacterales bacterium]